MLTTISSRREQPPSDLVDLLLECHQRIRTFVSLARAAARRIDAPDDQIVEACGRVERYFTEALPLHVADEEESILPRLRGHALDIDGALETMHDQHSQHQPRLRVLLAASSAVRERPHDIGRRTPLATAAMDLEHELTAHLALEESVVFPAIRRFLPATTQAEIVEEVRRRRRRENDATGAIELGTAERIAQWRNPSPT